MGDEATPITALSDAEHVRSLRTMAGIILSCLVLAVAMWLAGSDAQLRLQEALAARRQR